MGSDLCWHVVTGVVSKGKNGPTAVHTKLGWVLSSPITSGPTTWHSREQQEQAWEIMSFKQGGFNFRKFHTNTPLPQAKIDVKEFLGTFKRALQFSISDIVQAA